VKDPRQRFIEDDPDTLQWSSDPITTAESEKAEKIFRWIDRN